MMLCYVNLVFKVQTSKEKSWERDWCYVCPSMTIGEGALIYSEYAKQTANIHFKNRLKQYLFSREVN